MISERLHAMLAERKAREHYFPGLGEPAWNMLLDLALAKMECRKVSITSTCIASYAPASTALRHVDVLLSLGLIERRPDPEDARRTWLILTDPAAADLDAMLARPNLRSAK